MNSEKTSWLQKPIHSSLPAVTNEIALFAGIILLAIVTRFYDLGTRVMSHDESLHTYFSWLLYRGQGYQHTPMMHGPHQFHIIALTYFLFGVSDFTARIPAVLFSIATVWMVWYWRRYIGAWGMIVAAFLMVISPYMLYYGRYVRNESFVGFSGILLLYAILRYLEIGEKKYIYMATAATVLHFTSKETSFIYTAQALVFLGIYFITQITKIPWENKASAYRAFIILLAAGIVLFSVGGIAYTVTHGTGETISVTETAAPANPLDGAATPSANATDTGGMSLTNILFALGGLGIVIAGVIYFYLAYVKHEAPKNRAFDLLIVIFTFVLPQLTAFILEFLKELGLTNVVIPTESSAVAALDAYSMTVMGIVVLVLFAISIAVGLFWNREWWKYGALFWGVYTILYTTVFTNPAGFFSGVVGSLGYWLVQQGVERGSQPEYYYVLIQIPMYEFLPAIGTLVAIVLGLKKLFGQKPAIPEGEANGAGESQSESTSSNFGAFFGLMVFWSIASVAAFTIAGERMPWLTYHMAWPMVLVTGWAVGQIIELVTPYVINEKPGKTVVSILVLIVFVIAIFNILRSISGTTPPFQGTELGQLQATAGFIFPFVTAIASGVLLAYLMNRDFVSLGMTTLLLLAIVALGSSVINGASVMMLSSSEGIDPASLTVSQLKFGAALVVLIGSITGTVLMSKMQRTSAFFHFVTLTIFGLLAVQTARTAFRANYINYDDATEYLVYAHGATGVKDVMAQVEEISRRVSGGLNAVIAYDASAPDTGVSWPVVWYLRDYTSLRSFDQPTRSLREAVAVIVDQKNFDKIEPALGDGFYRFDYIRMWWPNQDYFNLDRSRVLNAITNPAIRNGIFDIWFDRDYTQYAQAVGSTTMTLTTWQPADQMRLYIRKDIASQVWNYGVGPSAAPVAVDPYEAGTVMIPADLIFNSDRYPSGLNAPRAIAAGLDNDFYVADSRNHRILHISSNGTLLHEWGTFAAIDYFSGAVVSESEALKQAPLGTFNEPWGVAVGPDGSVYVTDTWNHRVQKFSADGKPIKLWGQYGQPVPEVPESSSSFWGPRGVAVDSQGHVLVADTGNKRIVIFDSDGNYISEFGTGGFDPGQFDEPVGVAVARDGTVFVTDTWNQRVQSFIPDQTGTFYTPYQQWDVNAWIGQSLDNKPFLAVGTNNHVFITDPEGYRIIEFTASGEFVRTWGDFGSGDSEIGLAAGVAVDRFGYVWVTDAGNNRILRYKLP
ncbi:MAG: TIGR03663 family protein [Chloroflexi bacterium]|nr:TIGR03663 family protein [Chloroflexota bacterium]